MASTVNSKKSSTAMDFLKQAGKYIGAGTKDYFVEATPTISSTITETSATIGQIGSTIKNTSASVLPKIRQLKSQSNLRSLLNWFTSKEDEFDSNGYDESFGDWDDGTSASDIAEVQISETKESANQISGAVVESIHKSVESQISMSANIIASLDAQSAIIKGGFQTTNETLGKILEIMTKNTAALIETTASLSSSNNSSDEMINNGKFDLSKYKDIVKSNISKSELGAAGSMISSMLGMATSGGFTPKDLVSMLVGFGIDKAAPNLRKSLNAFDDIVSDTIMQSLIRLGDKGGYGPGGFIARMFGIDASRKGIDTSRSSIGVKPISFDTITKEAITSAIPGYLRKILVALGGDDEIYDYRSRSFKTKKAIHDEYLKSSTAFTAGSMHSASSSIQSKLGYDEWTMMMYDLMINDIGRRMGPYGDANEVVKKLNDPKFAKEYLGGLIGDRRHKNDNINIDIMASNMSRLDGQFDSQNILKQAATANAKRNMAMPKVIEEANKYGVDLSWIKDDPKKDAGSLMKQWGREDLVESGISAKPSTRDLIGVDYTNAALYEIYRKLDNGINVYQVGSDSSQRSPFKRLKEKYLKKPSGYRAKSITEVKDPGVISAIANSDPNHDSGENLLRNGVDEDGNPENLSKLDRAKRWGKYRGGQFVGAMMHGSSEDIKLVMQDIIKDVSGIAGDTMKKGISSINTKFGNISGYLGHKLFGSEYTYNEMDEDPKSKTYGQIIPKTIAKNEKGGVFGFIGDKIKGMLEPVKEGGKKWFSEVAGYFDYGDSGDKKDGQVASKRKKILSASVGAMAGAGILGGPIGVIMGAVAGNAIGQIPNIGEKLKEKLIGKDENGKPTGLLSKAADAVISPIQYHVGKALTSVGDKLKKNIFGPLSDLGYVIKERVSNKVSSIFGKVFNKILNVGMKAMGGIAKVGGWLFEKIVGVKAGVASAKVGVATEVAGFGINRITDALTLGQSDELKDGLAKRRGDRKKAIKENSTKWDDYKTWRTNKWSKNKGVDDVALLNEYTKEQVISTKDIESTNQEIKDTNADIATNTEKTVELLSEVKDKISGNNSSDDKHAASDNGSTIGGSSGNSPSNNGSKPDDEDKSNADDMDTSNSRGRFAAFNDKIKSKLNNRFPSIFKESDKQAKESESTVHGSEGDTNGFAGSAVGAAATTIMSGDNVNEREFYASSKIIDEAEDSKPNKRSIGSRLKSLFRMQKKENDEEGEKKEGFLSKILGLLGSVGGFFGGLLSNLPTILGLLGALYVIFKNPEAIKNLFKRIGSAVDGIFKFLGGGDDDQDATDVGANAALAIADVHTDSVWDLATPGKALYHTQRAGDGSYIENSYATEAKEELLWKQAARSQIAGVPTTGAMFNGLKANWNFGKAGFYENLSTFSKEHLGGVGSGWLTKKSDKALNKAAKYDEKANAPQNNNAGASVLRGLGDIAVLNLASKGSGLAARGIAKSLGVSDEGAATVGNVAEILTSGGLTWNMMKSTVNGKQSIVDKILDYIIKLFKMVGQKVGADKLFKKIGADKIMKGFEDAAKAIVDKIKNKFDELIVQKIQAKLAEWGVEVTASTITAGAVILAGGVAGLASGLCSVEHLFGVLPGEADGKMKAVAGTLGTILGALEWSPLGWIVVILDILDALLMAIPEFTIPTPIFTINIGGVGLKQILARMIYGMIADSEDLEAKQAEFQAEREWYNTEFNTNLDTATFSDMVNTTGFFSRIWNGKGSVQEDGHLRYDEAGVHLTNGGIKNAIVGQEKEYVHDEDGNVLRSDDGSAVVNIDKYGNEQKKDKKWGDSVSEWLNDAGGWLFGRKIYDIDEETGEAKWDSEKDTYVSNGRQLSLAEKVSGLVQGDGWNDEVYKSGRSLNSSITLRKPGQSLEEWRKEISENRGSLSTISNGLGNFMSRLNDMGVAISESTDDKSTIHDENGNELMIDINGKKQPIRYGDIKDTTKSLLDQSMSKVYGGLMQVSEGIDEWEADTPWSESGKKDAKSWVSSVLKNSTGVLGSALATIFGTGGSVGVGGPTREISQVAMNDGGGSGQPQEETQESGGNPLVNKGFKITSRFGPRTSPHSGVHKGVDLVPDDGSGTSEIGSRFSGKILSVKDDVPDDVHAENEGGKWVFPHDSKDETGNMVTIQTDDGMVVKNMHLKAGSIPSNIKPGATVNIGDRIGTMGSTGWSTGNHLHYEFRSPSGEAIDPTDSLSETTGWSNDASTGTYDPSSLSAMASSSSVFSTSDTSDSSGSEKGSLASFIDNLKSIGNKFLSKVTGGLLGSDEDTSSDSAIGISSTSTGSLGSAGSAQYLTGNCNNQWITIVRDVKRLVAEQQPVYNQQGSMIINYNGRSLKLRPDCTGIICAMLKYYGVMGENDNLNSTLMLRPGAIKDGFDQADWPGWENLVEGDIMVVDGHAEIFAFNEGNRHFVYNGGCTEALRTPGASSSSKSVYTRIWRCREEVSTMPVAGADVDAEGIWDYLRAQNLSEYATAGLMGNLYAESGLKTNNLQNSYESKLGSDEEYTSKVNSGEYQNFANDSAGYGLAQWTSSGRKAALYQRAKESGKAIDDGDVQLGHLMNELKSSYRNKVLDPIMDAQSVKEASDIVLHKFEAPKDQSAAVENKRAGFGQGFYDQFSGKSSGNNTDGAGIRQSSKFEPVSMDATDGMGGPEYTYDSNEESQLQNASISNRANYSRNRYSSQSQKQYSNNPAKIKNAFRGELTPNNEWPGENTSVDTGEVTELLREVLVELRAINGNTGNSNTLLQALGDTGIQDKDLRNQLGQFKSKTGSSSSGRSSSNRNVNSMSNNRMISSMIRP